MPCSTRSAGRQSDDARIGHYYLCVVDDGGKTVLTLPTTGNVGSLTLDLEQYQGKAIALPRHCPPQG